MKVEVIVVNTKGQVLLLLGPVCFSTLIPIVFVEWKLEPLTFYFF